MGEGGGGNIHGRKEYSFPGVTNIRRTKGRNILQHLKPSRRFSAVSKYLIQLLWFVCFLWCLLLFFSCFVLFFFIILLVLALGLKFVRILS